MATIDELRARAELIAEEQQIGGNTAERVGEAFDMVADIIEAVAPGDEQAVSYNPQSPSEAQKAQARENIGAQKDMSAMTDAEKQQILRTLDVVSYLPQMVDGARQQQARENIGAAMIPFIFEPFVAPGLNDSDVDQYLAEGRALQLSVDGNLVDYSQWAGGYLVWVVDDIDTISPYTRTTRVYRLNVYDDAWSVTEADYPSTEAMQGVVKDVSANPTSTQINAKNNAMNSAGINLAPNSVTIYSPGGSVAMNPDGIDLIPQGDGVVTIDGEEPLVKGDVFVSQIAQGTVVYAPNQSGARVSAAVVSVAEPTADAAKKYIAPSWSAVKRMVGDAEQIKAAVEAIEAVIPAAATAQNQLADKTFVNSSISSSTANFVGTFNSLAELQAVTGATNNDYGFVIETDAQGNQYYDRYKYNGTAWLFEYKVESTPFTAAQWAAIQSGITAALVTKLSALPTNTELTDALGGKQDVINDLAAIRSGAAAGATAVQPSSLAAKADKVSVVNHGTGDTTFVVAPNVLHVWGEVASLTLTLATPTDATIVNEYMVQFESGATATTLSLPSTITWVATPNIQASKTYQISIINGLGVIAEFGEGGA